MKPPDQYIVLDRHDGFTCASQLMVQKGRWAEYAVGPTIPLWKKQTDDEKHKIITNHRYMTLWRPSKLLKRGTTGTLLAYNENSFYRNNDNVTVAFYEVPGYQYVVVCWFENDTGERADGHSYPYKGVKL